VIRGERGTVVAQVTWGGLNVLKDVLNVLKGVLL
jgi:hypothetical protein